MVDPVVICDAIADDLAFLARAIDPTYFDWRYVKPDMLEAEHAPWLAVTTPQTSHTLVATPDSYMDDVEILVEWAVSIADEAGTMFSGAPDLIRQAMADLEPIMDRLRSYASGIPGFDNQVLGTLVATTRDASVGLVWRSTSRLTITAV